MFASAIVREMRRFFRTNIVEQSRSEGAFDCERTTFFRGLLGFQNNFQNVVGVFFDDDRRFAGVKTFNRVAKTVGPWPVGRGLLENLPATGRVLPDFVAVR